MFNTVPWCQSRSRGLRSPVDSIRGASRRCSALRPSTQQGANINRPPPGRAQPPPHRSPPALYHQSPSTSQVEAKEPNLV